MFPFNYEYLLYLFKPLIYLCSFLEGILIKFFGSGDFLIGLAGLDLEGYGSLIDHPARFYSSAFFFLMPGLFNLYDS